MKKLILTAAACLALPGIAFAAEPPAKPEKCCCDKMKEAGKDCCAEKDKMQHEDHGDHKMDAPKT
jgi:hypothetical protein